MHNRVNFFGVQLLDGVWHSVCLAWQTATGPSNNQGTVKLVVDGSAITRDKTLAGTRCGVLFAARLYLSHKISRLLNT